MVDNYRKHLKTHIETTEEGIKRQKESNYHNRMEKYLSASMKREDIKDTVREKEIALEYKKMELMRKLDEKNKRIEAVKQRKFE